MENASKALIIAGATFIAIMLISLFMFVFNAIGDYFGQQQAQQYSEQITAANRFFVESAYDVNPSVAGVQVYGYDAYNIIRKAEDVNNNPDSPIIIEITGSITANNFVNSSDSTVNITNLEKEYTYRYYMDTDGYVTRISFSG